MDGWWDGPQLDGFFARLLAAQLDLKAQGTSRRYGARFYRRWKYYLPSVAASFRVRRNQLWQIVLSKNGGGGGYRSVR